MNKSATRTPLQKNLRWILLSVILGIVAGIIMQFAFHNWIVSTCSFLLVGGIVFWHNPKWIYRRAAGTFIGLTCAASALFNFDIEGTFWGTHFHITSNSINPTIWFSICTVLCLTLVFLDEKGILEKWFDRKKIRQQSFQTFIDQIDTNTDFSLSLEIDSLHRFWYRADLFSFEGREKELEQLQEFCETDTKISWFAITGRGGLGKSRLAYEFVKQADANWKMLFLDWSDFSNYGCSEFEHYHYDKNLLVVIDYVSKDADSIGQWLRNVCNQGNRNFKLRILFLQREGITKNNMGELNYPVWYDQLLIGAEKNKIVRHLLHKNTFLALPKLSPDNLKRIIVNYIETNKKTSPTDDELDQLIESLQEIDANFQRPIYALFLADAWLENSKKVLDWKAKNLQEWLNYHEIRKIEVAFKGKKKDQEALKYILALATALEKVDVTSLTAKPLVDSVNRLKKYSDTKEISLAGLIRSFDLHAESEDEGIILHGIVPDIMGEYYCLTYLKRLSESNDSARLNAFIQTAWEEAHSNEFKSFLIRCINDFHQHKMTKWLLSYVPKGETSVEHYSTVLRYLSLRQDIDGSERTLEMLKELSDAQPLEWVILNYAYAIAYRSIDQSESIVIASIRKIEELVKRKPFGEIILLYAKILVNLTYLQKEKGATEAVHKLATLSKEHPSNDIHIEYAKGLVNLSSEQNEKRAAETIHILENLLKKHQIDEMIVMHAKGLANLAEKQPLDQGAIETTQKIKAIVENNPNENVAVEYARGLVNLSSKQNEAEADKTVKELEELSTAYPTLEIFESFGQGLVNLSSEQDKHGAIQTIKRMKKLSIEHPSEDIQISYASGLVNLSFEQESEEIMETLQVVQQLCIDHPADEIFAQYAKGLSNLAYYQNVEDASVTVQQLGQLSSDHPTPVIVERYARTLFNLSLDQERTDAEKTIAQIKQLSIEHPLTEIVSIYAKALMFLTVEQDASEIQQRITELEQLAKIHPIKEVCIEYAKGLVHLSIAMSDENEAIAKNEIIQQLANDYPYHDFFVEYIKGLFVAMMLTQTPSVAEDCIIKIRELQENHNLENIEEVIQTAEKIYGEKYVS